MKTKTKKANKEASTKKTSAPSPLAFNTDWQYAPAPESSEHVQLKKQYGHFIQGRFVEPSKGKYFATINPSTEQKIADIAEGSEEDVDTAVRAARKSYENVWSQMPAKERG